MEVDRPSEENQYSEEEDCEDQYEQTVMPNSESSLDDSFQDSIKSPPQFGFGGTKSHNTVSVGSPNPYEEISRRKRKRSYQEDQVLNILEITASKRAGTSTEYEVFTLEGRTEWVSHDVLEKHYFDILKAYINKRDQTETALGKDFLNKAGKENSVQANAVASQVQQTQNLDLLSESSVTESEEEDLAFESKTTKRKSRGRGKNEAKGKSKYAEKQESNYQALQQYIAKQTKQHKRRQLEEYVAPGTFERNEPRIVDAFHGLEGQHRKTLEVMCTVEWYPSIEDGGTIPAPSTITYAEVRRNAPKLLCDFYERHLDLLDQK